MLMGYYDGIQMLHTSPKHLLPEVWPNINGHPYPFRFYNCSCAQPLIMRIGGLACSALTTYHWDTLRDSSTEQRYTHIAHDSQPPTKKRWLKTVTNMKKLPYLEEIHSHCATSSSTGPRSAVPTKK